MGAIKDAVAEAVAEERADADSPDQANALTQMRSENKTLREEVSEMSRMLMVLSNQVATLKNAITSGKIDLAADGDGNGSGDGGGGGGGGRKGPAKRKKHPKFGEYKLGMALDESWEPAKKNWWRQHARTDEKNADAFKKVEKARLQAALNKLE